MSTSARTSPADPPAEGTSVSTPGPAVTRVPGVDAAAGPTPRGWRQGLHHPWQAARSTSLAQRFLVANLLILLVAGATVGIWVGNQLEASIIDRTASVTALYVESIIEPSVESLADGHGLTAAEIGTLNGYLASSPLADRVRSLRLWSRDGEVIYSPNAELIGRTFPVEGNLARAWQGEVRASMDDLSGEENAWERARWSRLLEMYIPVRERGSDRIVAVAEFYLPPKEIDQQVGEARLSTWLLVTLAILLSGLLLFGLVKRGSDTIRRQELALTRQVDELTGLLEENAVLGQRVNSAAQRTTMLNERTMRRVSSDLHDGPGQMLSLALLRLDALRTRAEGGRPASAEELVGVEEVLQEAMTDMRGVAAGLRVPELAGLDVEAVATRAVRDHERRSGTSVSLDVEHVPADVSLPVKIALFRALQEGLSNATRHGGSHAVQVTLGSRAPQRRGGRAGLELLVSDDGTGFDPRILASSEGLGLAGIREQAEILGGSFSVESAPGTGTRLRVWWPLQGREDEV
jgi:signal transduction histidine kinase